MNSVSLLRGSFRLLSRVSTDAASRLAVEVFRTPRRYSTPARERELLGDGEPFSIRIGTGTRIQAWSWGVGPLVILMHGWEGRGSQMAAFATPLARAGFRVVTFDAPGHGQSNGRKSSLPHFTWALRGIVDAAGAPSAIVAHALGCAAATLAARDGLVVPRLVFISPPLDPVEYTEQFGEMFGLAEPVIAGLRRRIEERFLRSWSDYSLAAAAPRMTSDLLVIHDRADTETRWSGGAMLAQLWPGAQLMTTEGLGHRRILRDPEVIRAVTDFAR